MSCGPVDGKFRLLDAYVGWSEVGVPSKLSGLDDPAGLRLARQNPGAVTAEVWAYMLPPHLARGCGVCDWYLLIPAHARLLRRQACHPEWQPLWTPACDPARFVEPITVAAWQHRVAVADAGARRIWVWERDGRSLVAEIAIHDLAAIGYTECGDLLAATSRELRLFGPAGEPRGERVQLPELAGRPHAIVGDHDGGLWLVSKQADGTLRLWHAPRGSHSFVSAGLDDLRAASLPATGLGVVTEAGFCLIESGRGGISSTRCWNWSGRAASSAEVGTVPVLSLHQTGELLTQPLDSGLPRCRWHRVQVDADVPPGTGLRVEVASTDEPAIAPHPRDWQALSNTALDFLIDRPPGRYLLLRITFSGDGHKTPVLRRVRLDFPRSSSLDSLPTVYRENPRAEDFSERFLSLFDASVADLDAAIEQFPAAFDVAGVRSELLPWLASFLDLAFDPSWDPARQRSILAALPHLYRLRGTVAGLQLAIRLVFDTEVAIQELAFERAWGKLGQHGNARLGGVRLFGKSKARFALGRSGLSGAPIKSYGNPDLDPVSSGAYRFRVLVPPGRLTTGLAAERLARLVESQKPAHTQATVRHGGSGFVIGSFSAIGVDSVLGPMPAPVIGATGNVRLSRMSVLWPARRGGHSTFVLGNPVVVGVQTVLE